MPIFSKDQKHTQNLPHQLNIARLLTKFSPFKFYHFSAVDRLNGCLIHLSKRRFWSFAKTEVKILKILTKHIFILSTTAITNKVSCQLMITESQKIINFDKSGLSTAMLNILIFKMSRIGMFKKVSTYSKGIKIWKKR